MSEEIVDVYLPPWINDRDGYILLKYFEKKEYLDQFIDGKIFFNKSDYFVTCDSKGRGDSSEGNDLIMSTMNPDNISFNMEIINGTPILVARDYSKNPENYKPSTVFSLSRAKNRSRKLTCFYSAFCNLESGLLDIPGDEHAKDFGPYVAIIIDRQKFFERIVNAIKVTKGVTEAQLGFVSYVPAEKTHGLFEWSPFKKYDDYAYQNEFRITFVDNTTEARYLEINRLDGIAVPATAEQIKHMKVVDQKIYYEYEDSVEEDG
jgi:hypothetical protein